MSDLDGQERMRITEPQKRALREIADCPRDTERPGKRAGDVRVGDVVQGDWRIIGVRPEHGDRVTLTAESIGGEWASTRTVRRASLLTCVRDPERPDEPNLDDAARIIRGLLYEDEDDRPQNEIEVEATQFLTGRMRRDTERPDEKLPER